jgi:hypothetical protein
MLGHRHGHKFPAARQRHRQQQLMFFVGRAVWASITPSMVSLPSPRIPARSFGRFDEILYLVGKAPDLTLARHGELEA